MALLGEELSPQALLQANSVQSLTQLKKCIVEQNWAPETAAATATIVCERLDPDTAHLDWSSCAATDPLRALHLEVLVEMFGLCSTDQKVAVLHSISLYVNPEVPWSNSRYSEIARGVLRHDLAPFVRGFMDVVRPNLLQVTDYRSTRNVARGLRPALGLRASAAAEDAQRSEWKRSRLVCALSSVVLLMVMVSASPDPAAVSMCTSFALNVLDDSDPLFKTQGCQLLLEFLRHGGGAFLQKSGLLKTFHESLAICLTYLPQLTAPETSLRLLKHGAYPALLQVVALDPASNYVSYLQILDANVMGSVSHISGRGSDPATNALLAYLVSLMSDLVSSLGLSVLVCLTRLNFMVCQLLTDPYLIDYDGGAPVVDAALGVQNTLMAQFADKNNPEATACFRPYVLDYLTAWAILAKRVELYGVGTKLTKARISENFRLLRQLAGDDEPWSMLDKCPELAAISTDS